MSRAVAKNLIFQSILKGIERASKNYCNISGREDFGDAPEYFLTCNIATHLVSATHSSLTIEDGVRDTMIRAGANGPGRPRMGLRRGGRFDLVVWWQQGSPRAVIEVKHPLYDPTAAFIIDIVRIRDVLKANLRASGTFQFGGLAFWTSAPVPQRKHTSISDRLDKKTEVLKEAASAAVGDAFTVKRHLGSPHIAENGAWGWSAVFLAIEPSGR